MGPNDARSSCCSTRPSSPAATSPAPTGPTTTWSSTCPPASALDVRTVEAGDTVDGHPIRIEPAIEVGNIFKLGTRYSSPLGATYLDESGAEQHVWMGCYGIGPARIAAAPSSSTPTSTGSRGRGRSRRWTSSSSRSAGRRTSWRGRRRALRRAARRGLSVLSTTATLRPGEKFADAELLGCPLRVTVGKRSLESGASWRCRCAGARDHAQRAARSGARRGGGRAVADAPVERRPLTASAACSGLDRSGPPPPETLRPAPPLRPWTIPNAIGYAARRR